jgi:hypothetical protein
VREELMAHVDPKHWASVQRLARTTKCEKSNPCPDILIIGMGGPGGERKGVVWWYEERLFGKNVLRSAQQAADEEVWNEALFTLKVLAQHVDECRWDGDPGAKSKAYVLSIGKSVVAGSK